MFCFPCTTIVHWEATFYWFCFDNELPSFRIQSPTVPSPAHLVWLCIIEYRKFLKQRTDVKSVWICCLFINQSDQKKIWMRADKQANKCYKHQMLTNNNNKHTTTTNTQRPTTYSDKVQKQQQQTQQELEEYYNNDTTTNNNDTTTNNNNNCNSSINNNKQQQTTKHNVHNSYNSCSFFLFLSSTLPFYLFLSFTSFICFSCYLLFSFFFWYFLIPKPFEFCNFIFFLCSLIWIASNTTQLKQGITDICSKALLDKTEFGVLLHCVFCDVSSPEVTTSVLRVRKFSSLRLRSLFFFIVASWSIALVACHVVCML